MSLKFRPTSIDWQITIFIMSITIICINIFFCLQEYVKRSHYFVSISNFCGFTCKNNSVAVKQLLMNQNKLFCEFLLPLNFESVTKNAWTSYVQGVVHILRNAANWGRSLAIICYNLLRWRRKWIIWYMYGILLILYLNIDVKF